MSPIVSNALEFVLERTGLEKALSEGSKLNNELEEQFLIENYIKAGYGVGVSSGDGLLRQEINEYSKLSVEIYKKDFAKIATEMGYRVVAESGFSITGFKGAILEKDGIHVLVIKGTRSDVGIGLVGDAKADIQIAFQKPPMEQLKALEHFVELALLKHKIDRIDIATGHSLGATLSTLWGIKTGTPVIGYDAPPDQKIAYEMYGKDKTEAADVLKIQSSTNVINSSGKQVGKLFTVDVMENSYDNINLDIFSNKKNALALIDSDIVNGIRNFLNLSNKKVYGTDPEAIAQEHGVDKKRIVKKFEVSGKDKIITSSNMHSDLKKEQIISNIHKDQEYFILPSQKEVHNIETQSHVIGGILKVSVGRHESLVISDALYRGQKLSPLHNLGSVDYVIDHFTNHENESCQKFLGQIMPSIAKHPAFEGLSNEEIYKLVENNLPAVAQKLKIVFNPLQEDK